MTFSDVLTNYRTKRPQLVAILKSEDQAQLTADLTAFFGKNEGSYLRHAAVLAAQEKLFLPSWHWPAFLTLGYGWALYRRLYTLAAGLFTAQFITTMTGTNPRLVPAAVVLLVAYFVMVIFMALFAKSIYLGFALNAIARADDRRIVAHKRAEYIAKQGGTSILAGLAGIAVQIVAILITAIAASPTP